MRHTFLVFSTLLLLSAAACKSDSANPENAAAAQKSPEAGNAMQLETNPDEPKIVTILGAEDFDKFLSDNPNIPLVDFRTPEEFERAHIPRAVNIPFVLEGLDDKIKHLKGSSQVALYCANGIRSGRAAEALEKLGIQQIKLLDKGIYSWAVAHKMQISSK